MTIRNTYYLILLYLFMWFDRWIDLFVAIVGIVTFNLVCLNWELRWRTWWTTHIYIYIPKLFLGIGKVII